MSYKEVEEQYRALQRRKSDQSGSGNGAHYLLVFALMSAGVDCRGLTNEQIEGEAMTYLMKNAKEREGNE